ncbi:MAG: rhodanese-like domain-containing protein [Dehalococcoidales bacterium]|jgi:rhodanese-related sulfurtransferase|nr:rhodanese-like domain-containing protein [Dehalococcoidales bacterium]MDD3264987.1 rhodanese-like domain-containing protein [Dehalococcoidales bacterium]MDD4322362.1 rhodanese-like domain-containing protein [Dehalococcoidales bacterium]MDD4794894.1 rhodanese-like domain-containing protein [Dehalococcoidales bacterium]MDD5498268.1 rhodanese-like domain-containing protein [Dehalococcoidales bacterium]
MKRSITVLAVITMAIGLITGCSGNGDNSNGAIDAGTRVEVEGGAYWNLTPAELYEELDESMFVFQYDVINMGNIPGTDQFINHPNIASNMDKLPADKSAIIIVYCSVGAKSVEAASYLVGEGYTSVYNLAGGSAEWRNQGYPVVAG